MQILDGQNKIDHFPLAIVISRFNEEITEKLYQGASQRLRELQVPDNQVTVVWVPGAVEIPFMAQQLARSNRYQAIIALGAVIRGDTSHYDYVCEQVSQGCQAVSLKENIPVIFGILTTENIKQAEERSGGSHGNKGSDAVDAAFEMVSLVQQITL